MSPIYLDLFTIKMEEKNEQKKEINLLDIPSSLEESLEIIAVNAGFITYKISCENLSTKGGSYMGIIYEADIVGQTTEGDKEINIFVKNILENEQMKIYSVSDVFNKEWFFYKELAGIYTNLQDKFSIPANERFHIPKIYKEGSSKSIILEHLGKRGFKINPRMDTVSLQYAKLCIQELAKFHALSFVVQKKKPEYFKENIATVKQPYNFAEDWYGFVKNMYNFSISCLEDDVKSKVAEKILEKVDNYPKYMSDTSGVCTLCHGDFKHNNVMSKEDNGEVIEVMTIDYQILHYGCPILDFLYFIFNGTDQEFRRNHLSDLKDLYYETLKTFLEYFKMDIEKIYPRKEFERVYKEKLDFGLMINVFYVPFLFAMEDDAPEVATQSLSTLSFNVDKRFTERFRGVVDDFVNWGYL